MSLPLKDQNALRLYAVVAANLVAFFALQRSGALAAGDWLGAFDDWQSAAPAALGLIFIGILNAQVDALTKARLIYLRINDPLPGAEAFTRWGPGDERVDMSALAAKFSALPITAADQNRLWYRIFKSVESDAGVEHAHREYLFTRDYAFLAALMIPILGLSALFSFPSAGHAALYSAALVGQLILSARAARHHGRRLVCTALAVAGARTEGPRAAVPA
ncbi:hypothetical protein U91I_00602 [alpha proteobacterium U9-1i]|nr:hypothetical protein U91I_00602 [alpha proteobacterium U9-1i]